MNAVDRLKAVVAAAGMLVGTVALWTANPVAWLWLGSQVDAGGPPSMTAVVVVVLGVVLTAAALATGIAALHRRYRQIRGIRTTVRLRVPWLATPSRRGRNRPRELELTMLDVIVISSVLIAIGLYEYWFLFEAGSPLDQRTGRR